MKALRRNLKRVTAVLLLLFVLLGAYGAYSLHTYGNRWFASNVNTFARQKKQDVKAGNVYDRQGYLLAASTESSRLYAEDAAVRRAMVHMLGDTTKNVSNGVESFMSVYLYGFRATFPERAQSYFAGVKRTGDSVLLTADAQLSAYASSLFPSGKAGALVVMNYKTGEVLCELSFPQFDPLSVTESTKQDPQKPFYNRAVQGLYAPGSTFKIVTALSALENLPSAQTRAFQCTGLLQLGEHYITDAGTRLEENKLTSHGQLTLRRAFQVSCNNTFARLALEIGDEKLLETAERLGFNDNFLFRDLVVENSSYPLKNRTDKEIAWTGAGQSALLVTPMHMCMITSAVANGGVMMEPMLLSQVLRADGQVREEFAPRAYGTVMTGEQADVLKEWMRAVVTGGTGTRADIAGAKVCGKTGSAEKDGQEETDAWFVGFLDEDEAPYALSVVVENAGGGGSVAAPIAKKVFEYLLGGAAR